MPFWEDIKGFRARHMVLASDIANWPAPRKDHKIQLSCDLEGDYALRALRALEKRADCDCIKLSLTCLSDNEIRRQLDSLFQHKDRTWEIALDIVGLSMEDPIDESQLPSALAVLKPVSYLWVESDPGVIIHNDVYNVLKNMPRFDNLQSLDLSTIPLDQHDVEYIYDIPSIPPGAKISILPRFPLDLPVFSNDVARRIHSYELKFDPLLPTEVAVTMVQAITALPELEELTVRLPENIHHDRFAGCLSALFTWLQSPHCTVTTLDMEVGHPDQLSQILQTISKVSMLQYLGLKYKDLALDMERFCETVLQSSTIHHIGLEGWCCKEEARMLLQLQQDCRSRCLTVKFGIIRGVPDAILDRIYHISLVHQAIKKVQASTKEEYFPTMSTLPLLLAKMGKSLTVPSIMVNRVGIDPLYGMMKQLLSSYSHNLVSLEKELGETPQPCVVEDVELIRARPSKRTRV